MLNEQIQNYPEGNLICTRNNNRIKWYNNSNYLPKSEREFAEQLAIKKYLLQKKTDLLHQAESIDLYLKHYSKNPPCAEKLLSETSNYFELLSPYFSPKSQELMDWMKTPYQRNLQNPEHLIHKTITGELVRSKSEVLISTVLHINKIPFRYECMLQLGKRSIFPDFTIRHPENGKLFYWEHFGMMDEALYRQNACSKIELYASYGIIPSIHLITTYETSEYPLSIEQVENIVHNYFLN